MPVEYGAVNAVSACSGLIFYKEYQNMADWQLALIVIGVVVILTGIGIGNLSPPSLEDPLGSGSVATTSLLEVNEASLKLPNKNPFNELELKQNLNL